MKPLLFLTVLTTAALAQDLGGDLTLHRLLIDGEDWKVVAEGLGFADAPGNDAAGNFYFADMRGDAAGIYKVAPDGAKTRLSAESVSGMKWAPDGRMICCQGSQKRLIAIAQDGTIDVLAENVQPNDLVVTAGGVAFFTDTGKKQVVRVDIKTKAVSVADEGITGPNGIALSPDGATLAVSDYRGGNVWTFVLSKDGNLSGKTPYMTLRRPVDPKGEFKFNEPPPLLAASGGDGMCTDAMGRFFVSSTMGVQVFDPTGRECGLLPKPQPDKPLTSCAIAGDFLYVTNGDKIYRRKMQAKSWAAVGKPMKLPDAK